MTAFWIGVATLAIVSTILLIVMLYGDMQYRKGYDDGFEACLEIWEESENE